MSTPAEQIPLRPDDSAFAPGGDQATRWVLLRLLRTGDSPRLGGVDDDHAQMLAAAEATMPPILVHRGSMRVVDGMHRLRAAQLRGDDLIEVRFFDGSDDDAFVAGVESNATHGLPLTLADRKAAAARILASHVHYSDRRIAVITGLTAATVAAIRRGSPAGHPAVARLGQDGRVRPLSSAAGRRLARDAIAAHPHASLREIAKIAGISPGTARDVRERVRRGDDPVPRQQDDHRNGHRAAGGPAGQLRRHRRVPDRPVEDPALLLERLRKDPSLRLSERGRALLRWLDGHVGGLGDWKDLVDGLPPHTLFILAEVARLCAEEWRNAGAGIDFRLGDDK